MSDAVKSRNIKRMCCIFFSILIFSLISCHHGTINNAPAPIPTNSLRIGDIAFRKGNGLIGSAVASVEKESLYSHVGIVVRIDNEWMVIHAVPGELDSPSDVERVKCETITGFFSESKANHGEIIRVESIDSVCAVDVQKKALQMYKEHVLFDKAFDLCDSDSVYCTELVYLCFLSGGIDLTEGRRTHISVPFFHSVCILPEDIYKYSHKRIIFKY